METTRRKYSISLIAILMSVLIMALFPLQTAFAEGVETGTEAGTEAGTETGTETETETEVEVEVEDPAYLKAAKAAYGIELVYNCAEYNNDIISTLQAAEDEASVTDPVIVYAGSGNYTVSEKKVFNGAGAVSGIYVPENIVLVGETDSIITDETSNYSKPLIILGGSIYGFKINCNLKSQTVIKYKNGVTYSTAKAPSGKQINGNTEKVQIVGPGYTGIQAITVKNININNNIIRDGKTKNTTGISLLYSAKANSISGNKISNLGSSSYGSAISLCHSDAVAIDRNVIKNVAGHGISTDSEQSGKSHAYCRINYIRNNTINGAKHGIWLEHRCQVTKSLSGNTITNCVQNGIAVSGTKSYVGGCEWSIYSMSNNKITQSKRSNLSISGAYGKVKMVSGNTLDVSKQTNCVTLDKKAKLYITGKNNIIKRAKGNGVYVANGSYFKITGKSNKIISNTNYGVSLYKKSKAVISYTNLKSNKKGSARVGKGSTLKLTKCSKGKIVKSSKV